MNRNEQHDPCGCWPTTYEGAGIDGAWMNLIYRTVIGDNRWHNYVYVVDGSNSSFNQIKIYKDGLLISSLANISFDYNNNSSTIINTANAVPLKFGRSMANQGVATDLLDRAPTEFLDDIAIYNRALSPLEVQQLSIPITYRWSTGDTTATINVSPTVTTTYYLTVSNGISSCTDSVRVTVNPVNRNFFAQDTIKACGTSYTLNAGTGTSYLWNTGATARTLAVTNSGWYKCRVTTGVCTETDSVFVSITRANILNNDTTINRSLNLTLQVDTLAGVTPRPQFRWSTGATTTSISVFPLVTTTYYCTVSNGISTCTDSVKITVNDKFNLSAPTLKICGPQDISAATTVDVPITVKVFNSIVGFQGSIKWDSTVLKYQSTFNYAPGLGLSSGNFNNASANTLLYSWLDVNLTGQTLPDSSVLFTIRYNIVPGAWGKSTAIQFANTPNALEAIQEPAKNLIVLTQSGLVSIGARPVLDTLRISGCGNVVYLGTNYTSSVNVSTTLRNTSGCDSIYRTAIISVTPIPVISAVTANSPLFIGDNLQFNVAGQNLTGATYSWTGPNSFTSSAQNPTLTATAASSGQYRLIFIQACKRDTQYVSVTVNAGISGRIITPLRQPVSRVSLLQNNQSSLINGSYALAVNPSLPLVLKASKNNDINKSNGVSAIDIVLIQNHILQRSLLGDPYKLIAADVNKSGTISTLDLLYIKRMILGLDTTYPGNNLWSFVDSSYVFPNPANPFPYKDSFSYNAASLQSNKTNQTFLGIKLGDVNYDWDVNQARPAPSDNIELFHEDVWVKEGNEIHIPVRVRNFKELLGLQFTLNFNHQKLRFNRVEKNPIQLRFATNRLESGKMSFVWTEDYNVPTTLLNDALLMELVFDKVADFSEEELTLSADVASIEAWDKHFTKHFITKGSGKIKRLPDSPVWSVRPNPTKGNVFIHFVVRDKQKVHAELTDNLGRIVFQQENDLPAGIVEWRVDLQQNGMLPPGIYYLRIPEIDKQIKKLVIIK